MGRRRTEWPEPWERLRWSSQDERRIQRLLEAALRPLERQFVREMASAETATLQQVAYMRSLAKRYRANPAVSREEVTRLIRLDDD